MNTPKKPRRMARPPYVDGSDAAKQVDQITIDSAEATTAEKRVTKQSLVVDLLQRDGGASLAEIVEATGWLPHTARAALTGLRKKGHAIVRSAVDGTTRYMITPAASE